MFVEAKLGEPDGDSLTVTSSGFITTMFVNCLDRSWRRKKFQKDLLKSDNDWILRLSAIVTRRITEEEAHHPR